jgi:hypothetical protein
VLGFVSLGDDQRYIHNLESQLGWGNGPETRPRAEPSKRGDVAQTSHTSENPRTQGGRRSVLGLEKAERNRSIEDVLLIFSLYRKYILFYAIYKLKA